MKQIITILLFISCIILSSCLKDKSTTETLMVNNITISQAEAIAKTFATTPQPIKATGKIGIYGNYAFMIENYKGIHVINQSNLSNPNTVAFISVPGVVDIAMANNYLYCDAGKDLLVWNIENVNNITLEKRIDAVFPRASSLEGDRIIIGIETIVVKNNIEINEAQKNGFTSLSNISFSSFSSSTSVGTSGSMSRFAITQNKLYCVDNNSLRSFNITANNNPTFMKQTFLGGEVETIFPRGTELFIGTTTGMLIYKTTTEGGANYLSGFSHARVCDPVVADNNYAYVTTRSQEENNTNSFFRGPCFGTPADNELTIANVQNLNQTIELSRTKLKNPYGLSIDGNTLLVCDGGNGLVIFDVTNRNAPLKIAHLSTLPSYDIIAENGKALVWGKNEIVWLDYSDVNNIKKLSSISVTN